MVRKIFVVMVIGLLGVGILMVSLARAGVEIMTKNGSLETMGKKEITVIKGNKLVVYKLPETGILPNNPLYLFKRVRDHLWLVFSYGINKSKIALLLADKKAAEFGRLATQENIDWALESGNEAVDKLEYAYYLSENLNISDVAKKLLLNQIYEAGYAYKQVFVLSGDKFNNNLESYKQLLNRINEWNKKQEKSVVEINN